MSSVSEQIRQLVQDELAQRANPVDAGPMQAYLKTEMPFYGVKKPGRTAIERLLKKRFRLDDRDAWEEAVRALWALPHREEKYLAIAYAKLHPEHAVPASLPLFEQLIREGAWWDFVDDVAGNLVGRLWSEHRAWTEERMDRWIDDDDLWIRRTAILGQLKHKEHTDVARLFRYCRERMHEREFFIRKAIGWALRQYSYTDPDAVKDFLRAHRDELSGLSYREGAKGLVRKGLM